MYYHFLISGKVQGVGYRRWLQNLANSRKYTGWVRNLADQRVEAIIEMPEACLTSWIEDLRRGPQSAKVTDIKVKAVESQILNGSDNSDNLRILFDAENPIVND